MAQLSNVDFYNKWSPLLADNEFQNIDGPRLDALMADMRDSFASVATLNASPVPPATNFDPVTRELTAMHLLGTAELEYSHHNGGFSAYTPLQIDDLAHAQGEWRFRVKADTGRNASQTTDSPAIAAKAVVNPAGPGTIKSTDISDASPAGRDLLTAADVPAQRQLLDQLGLKAGAYGAGQPKFDTLFDKKDGALAYLLKAVAALAKPVVVDAPTNGRVDDTADTFAGDANPLFPALGDYEIYYPGSNGTQPATNGRADMVSGVLTIRGLTGPIDEELVGMRVAASGSRPASAWLTNKKKFTGVVVVVPATPALTAALAISVANIVAGNPITFTVTPAGGIAPYSYQVVATDQATGQTTVLGSAASGQWTPSVVGNYEIDTTVTDSSSPAKTAQAVYKRYLQVQAAQNRIPVADAGQDVTMQLPTSSVALMGTASDPDTGDTLTYAWRQITGPNTAAGLPATSLNVVASGLAAGTYQFGFRSTDNHGAQSVEDFVLVTVQAAATPSAQPVILTPVNSDFVLNGRNDQPDSNGYTRRDALDCYKPILFPQGVTGLKLRAKTSFTLAADLERSGLSLEVNSGFAQFLELTAGNVEQEFTVDLPANSLLSIAEGWQQRAGEQGNVQVVQFTGATIPGGTAYSFPARALPSEGIVDDLNSRSVGAGTTNPARFASGRQLGKLRGADVLCMGYASAQLRVQLDTPAKRQARAQQVVARLAPYTKRWYIIRDSRNDYGAISTSDLTAWYQDLFAQIHALDATIQIVIVTSLPLADGSEAPWVSAESAAAQGLSYVRVATSATAVSASALSDGNHLGDAGETDLANYITDVMDLSGNALAFTATPLAYVTATDATGAAKVVLRCACAEAGVEYRFDSGTWQSSSDFDIRSKARGFYQVSARLAADGSRLTTKRVAVPEWHFATDLNFFTYTGNWQNSTYGLPAASESPFVVAQPFDPSTGVDGAARVRFHVDGTWEVWTRQQTNVGSLYIEHAGNPAQTNTALIPGGPGNQFTNIGLSYRYPWNAAGGDVAEDILLGPANSPSQLHAFIALYPAGY